MIRCAICGGRVRPPKLAWTDTGERVRFYHVTWNPLAYAKELERLAKKVPFVHEGCLRKGERSGRRLVALDLETRRVLRRLQRTISPAGSAGPTAPGARPSALRARAAAPAKTQNSSDSKA